MRSYVQLRAHLAQSHIHVPILSKSGLWVWLWALKSVPEAPKMRWTDPTIALRTSNLGEDVIEHVQVVRFLVWASDRLKESIRDTTFSAGNSWAASFVGLLNDLQAGCTSLLDAPYDEMVAALRAEERDPRSDPVIDSPADLSALRLAIG